MVLPVPSTHWPPAWQVSPGQQAAPTAPQFMQTLGPVGGFAQPRPALHVLPAQHSWPLAPHGWQVSSPVPVAGGWQECPALHWLAAAPPQHCCPLPPQTWQTGSATPGGSTQTWPVEQVSAPPPVPGQQGCPVPPQAAHVVPPPVAAGMHAAPLWQLSPGQQAVPTAPQFMQVLGVVVPGGFAQPRPALQVMPAQQF